MEIRVPKFNITTRPGFWLITGRRMVGKTILTDNLVSYLQTQRGVIISNDFNFYNNRFPESNVSVYDEWNPGAIDTLIQHQKQNKKDKAFVVIDDRVDNNITTSKQFRLCSMSSRTLRITLIVATQNNECLSKYLRQKVDYVFAFPTKHTTSLLWEYYFCSVCRNLDQFKAVIDTCITSPYECLVMDFVHNKLHWYKAIERRKEQRLAFLSLQLFDPYLNRHIAEWV